MQLTTEFTLLLHKVEAKWLKKPYMTTYLDLYSPDGNLTVSATPVLRWWTIAVALKVSQGKAFFIPFASPGLFFMQL